MITHMKMRLNSNGDVYSKAVTPDLRDVYEVDGTLLLALGYLIKDSKTSEEQVYWTKQI